MMPARMSASMLICLPGMASRVKRAATSATRSAPLVMTMNCTSVMIRKITAPTTKLPPHHELAEGPDHLAGIRLQQDQPGGGDIERQPVERRDQQQRREGSELRSRSEMYIETISTVTATVILTVSSSRAARSAAARSSCRPWRRCTRPEADRCSGSGFLRCR